MKCPPFLHLGRWVLGLLLVAAICVIFGNRLGAHGMWDPWESLYAEAAHEMEESDSWLVPTYRGRPRLSKPILTYWGIRGGTAIFGDHLWAIRLPTALAALLAVLIVWRALSGIGGFRCGFLAALILATSPFYYLFARRATPDTYLIAGMAIAAAGLTRAYFGGEPRRRWYLLGYLGVSMGVLGKGPLGVVLPVLAVAFFVLYTFDYGRLRSRSALRRTLAFVGSAGLSLLIAAVGLLTWWGQRIDDDVVFQQSFETLRRWLAAHGLLIPGLLISTVSAVGLAAVAVLQLRRFFSLEQNRDLAKGFRFLLKESAIGSAVVLATSGAWYVGIYLRLGSDYIDSFLIHRHLGSFASVIRNSGKVEFYFESLLLGLLPWFAFLPAALAYVFSGRRREDLARRPELFLAGWALTSAFLFMMAVTQFYHYIFPAFPPLVMMIAICISRWVENGVAGPRLRACLVAGILLVVTPVRDLLGLTFDNLLRLISPHSAVSVEIQRTMLPWTYGCFALLLVGLLLFLKPRWRLAGLTFAGVSMLVFSVAMTGKFMVDAGRFKSPGRLVENYRTLAETEVLLVTGKQAPTLVYHTGNRARFFEDPSRLLEELRPQGGGYLVGTNPQLMELMREIRREGGSLRIVDRDSHYRYKIGLVEWKAESSGH